MKSFIAKIKKNSVNFVGYKISWGITKCNTKNFKPNSFSSPYNLHIGPGPNWVKPDNHWIDVDIDPNRGDLIVNFQEFTKFPLCSGSVSAIYAAHIFEHISIYVAQSVFLECYRVLNKNGVIRIVIPDVRKSIGEYLAGNNNFELFKRRKARALKRYGLDYTLFDCLREDFVSRSGQKNLLGEMGLAHQNAWDFETLKRDLVNAGFIDVVQSDFQRSTSSHFDFEGSFESEANEDYRSLYVEAKKG